jgi:hypothetical protein
MVISFERAGAPPDGTMPVDALQNFEKTTIYPPDALDMFLTVLLFSAPRYLRREMPTLPGAAGVLPNSRTAVLCRPGPTMKVQRPDELPSLARCIGTTLIFLRRAAGAVIPPLRRSALERR